jgi:hypothetical protein
VSRENIILIISGILFVVLSLIIIGKMTYINIVYGKEMTEVVDSIAYKNITVVGNGGNLYSADGQSLWAYSYPTFTIRWDAKVAKNYIDRLVENNDTAALSFHNIENLIYYLDSNFIYKNNNKSYRDVITDAYNNSKQYTLIASDVTFDELKVFKTFPFFSKHKYNGGMILETNFGMNYTNEKVGIRTIGKNDYTDDKNEVGIIGAISSDWTQIDADGDGNMWMISPVSHGTGANCVTSESYINYVGALTPDNYLITPELSLPEGGTLTYWVCAQDGAYPYDHYGIFYSTTGNGVNDFNTTPLFEETLTAKHVGPKGDRGTNDLGTWYERTVELPAGTKYVAFRHFNCTDAFRMNIDEVVISTEGGNIDPPTDVTFNIYRDGALIATTTSFEYVDEDLNEGTYEYCVEVVCSENNVSDQVCTEATVGGDLCNPVRNLEGEVDDNVVILTWDYPEGYAAPQEETLSWSGAFDNNAIGTNGAADFDVAHRFEVSDLTDYVGWKLTKITFYPYEQFCDYSLRAWTGTNAANMVLDQPVSDVVIGGENTVAVETDVTIEANQEFWIGYRCNATAGFPAGVDAGPAVTGKGDMIKFDGVWDNISGMGLSYNFAIVGTIVSSKGDVANITINDAPNRVFEGELAITNRPSLAIKEQATRTRGLTGYKIFLEGEEIATINDPTVNTFTDDFSFAKEDVEYCVQAIYSTCESENVCESVTITGIEGNSNLSVYPNPANSIVNIDGVSVEKVYVYNNIGQLVEMLSSNQVNVSSYAKGVYMFNIVSVDGEVHKVKVVVH